MSQNPLAARCGIYCGECPYREETGCPGCLECAGSMFWGTCPIAVCSIGRNLSHCGECPEFPCEQLKAFAYDAEQGDDGRRIRQLERWNAIGFEAWLDARGEDERP
jgi:hypothetical protein